MKVQALLVAVFVAFTIVGAERVKVSQCRSQLETLKSKCNQIPDKGLRTRLVKQIDQCRSNYQRCSPNAVVEIPTGDDRYTLCRQHRSQVEVVLSNVLVVKTVVQKDLLERLLDAILNGVTDVLTDIFRLLLSVLHIFDGGDSQEVVNIIVDLSVYQIQSSTCSD